MLDAEFNSQVSRFIDRIFPESELIDVQQLTAGASQQTFKVSVRHREGHEGHYALRRAQPGLERSSMPTLLGSFAGTQGAGLITVIVASGR